MRKIQEEDSQYFMKIKIQTYEISFFRLPQNGSVFTWYLSIVFVNSSLVECVGYKLLIDHTQLFLEFYLFIEATDLLPSSEGCDSLSVSWANLVMPICSIGMSIIFIIVRVIFLPSYG